MPDAANELLKVGEVAKRLGVSDETVRGWAKTGKLRYVKLPSGGRRFRAVDVDAILTPVEPTVAD